MLKIGGIKQNKSTPLKTAFSAQSDGEEEEEEDVLSRKNNKKPIAKTRVNAAPLSRVARDTIQAARQQDASVFEYDAVFDSMKAGQREIEEQRKLESKERKPRYVEGLLKTAEQRKLDRVKAEDVMTARARAKEGDEFTEKDAFVTPAYLAQQEELRKAEEAEKLKEAQGVKNGGMASFYANYLANSSASHEAAMEAAKQPRAISTTQVYDEEPVSDVQLAREAVSKTGQVVEMNEDGQIVDRTQLLVGGLNVTKKKPKQPRTQGPSLPATEDVPTTMQEDTAGGFAVPMSQRTQPSSASNGAAQTAEEAHYSGLSEAQRRRLQRERQSIEIQKQIQQLQATKAQEEEEERTKEIGRLKRRNDESRVEEMKRLAMERREAKKKKLESETTE